MQLNKKKVILIILDGWGHRENKQHNAILSAKTPNWDMFNSNYPTNYLKCSGIDVGLPPEQMGNSEVGHMHIGAGRLIEQDLTKINRAISNNQLDQIETLSNCFAQLKITNATLHLIGLCSNGGVHSHISHLEALIDLAIKNGVKNILIHAILDGRDTQQKSAIEELPRLEEFLATRSPAKIATIQGRYYAMDRNENWDRIKRAYDLIACSDTKLWYDNAISALSEAYKRNETDEFVAPSAIIDNEIANRKIQDNDVGLFFNFRADRARQLSECLTSKRFKKFTRENKQIFKNFITMTKYADYLDNPVVFPNRKIENTLGEVISNHKRKQVRIAETEKYAHVTFFLNGGREKPFPGEERVLIPSPNVATYDMAPEMSAGAVTLKICDLLKNNKHEAIIANFANADMVGHTGDLGATIKAIEFLDHCLGKIHDVARDNQYDILITADHGNAELMYVNKQNDSEMLQPHTAHTNNLVPIIYIGSKNFSLNAGDLKDIAPTMLSLMGLEIPKDMAGKSLIRC